MQGISYVDVRELFSVNGRHFSVKGRDFSVKGSSSVSWGGPVSGGLHVHKTASANKISKRKRSFVKV